MNKITEIDICNINKIASEYIRKKYPDEKICYSLYEAESMPYDVPFWWIDKNSITRYMHQDNPKWNERSKYVILFTVRHGEPVYKTEKDICEAVDGLEEHYNKLINS